MSTPEAAQPKRQAQTQIENTVRLRGDDLERIHEDLDAQAPPGGSVRRQYVRWPFRRACIRVDIISGSRIASTLKYACRNLSGSGVSILHSAYIHPGTECMVYLPSLAGKLERLPGRIKRCRHFRGHIHEVGIHFAQSIEVGMFVELDPYNDGFAVERADPARLGGSVLHVEATEEDRKQFRNMLRETQFDVVSVRLGAEALSRFKEGFDVVVIDSSLPDGKGPEIARKMREAGCKAPIIVTSADGSPEMRAASRLSKVGAFIVKPLKEAAVLRALADLLPERGPTAADSLPIHCSLKPDDPARKNTPAVIAELQTAARDIQAGLDSSDVAGIRKHCSRIKTMAGPAGFEPVAALAVEAMRLIKNGVVGEADPPLRALIDGCRRVSIGPEPATVHGAGKANPAAAHPPRAKAA